MAAFLNLPITIRRVKQCKLSTLSPGAGTDLGTQALDILKPVTLVFLMGISGLDFYLGGEIMHKIAMIDPFYWLLQLIYGLYTNDLKLKH